MALFAVLAVHLEALRLLEGAHSLFGLRAKVAVCAVLRQAVAQLEQVFLQLLHIVPFGALCEQPGTKRIFRLRGLYVADFSVVDKRQEVPVRPAAILDAGLHAPIRETAFLHGVAAADVHAYMAIRAQRDAGHLRQAVHGPPCTALVLCIGEHAVGRLVRAAVCAIGACVGAVRANALDHTLAAAGPAVPLDEPDAVRADLLLRDVVLVATGASGAIVGWILRGLARTQAFGAFIDAGAVPIGLSDHALAKSHEVLVSERSVDSVLHVCPSLNNEKGGGRPSPRGR